jgi:hypothetical protein
MKAIWRGKLYRALDNEGDEIILERDGETARVSLSDFDLVIDPTDDEVRNVEVRHVGESGVGAHEAMTVHVVIREDQNEYGFIDTSVVGLFRSRNNADIFVESSASGARDEGLRVCGDPGTEPDWQVSWLIESHTLL